jgi:hypothetical protein
MLDEGNKVALPSEYGVDDVPVIVQEPFDGSELDTSRCGGSPTPTGQPHNFHVHDAQFAVASVDGRRPPRELRGWKDTIFMPPGREVELLLRFTDYFDPGMPSMFHCHLLLYEDQGMMGQFVVVKPGQAPGTPLAAGHDH